MAVPSPSNKTTKRNPCHWCVKAVKWIPVLFILTIVSWSYYAYVVQLCILTVQSTAEKAIFLILYHILFIMFVWSYFQTIFIEVGRVPDKFKLPQVEYELLLCAETKEMHRQILEGFAQNLPTTNRTVDRTVRYCDKCRLIKPDRTHHCSVCGECVLKMDHHCPWINNCVNFNNYKCFILFLGYALLYCIYVSLTSLQYFISFWKGDLPGMGRFNILFLFFVAVMFAVSLISLFAYHCYLVLQNRTTLEAFRAPIFNSGPDKHGFNLGSYANFQEVFGDNPKLWFIPINTSLGDGVEFPVQSRHHLSSYQSMDRTETSLGDGYTFPQRHVDEDTEQLLSDSHQWDEDGTNLS